MAGAYPGSTTVTQPGLMDEIYQRQAGQGIYMFNATKDFGGTLMNFIRATNLIQDEGNLNYPGKYVVDFADLNNYSNVVKRTSEVTSRYDEANEFTTSWTDTKYYYDNINHMQPTRIVTNTSKGDSTIVRKRYTQDNSATGNILDYMRSSRLGLDEPLEEFTTFKNMAQPGSQEYIRQGFVNTFRSENSSVYPDKVFKILTSGDLHPYNGPYYSTGYSPGSGFAQQVAYDLYVNGNIHKYTDLSGSANVILWGYNNQYPIAKATNANNIYGGKSSDVAYTSFETADDGNWAYAGTSVADTTTPSGIRAYPLSAGDITKKNATASGKYIISYWYKSGSTVNVSGGTVSAAVIKNTSGEWIFAEREISGTIGTVKISGTGSIDELRFHPYESQMTTYVYEPLIGLKTVFDPKGGSQHYEYDDARRLKTIRDQNGNIVKGYKYILGSLN